MKEHQTDVSNGKGLAKNNRFITTFNSENRVKRGRKNSET